MSTGLDELLPLIYEGRISNVLESIEHLIAHRELIADRFARGLEPTPIITVAEWADRHRVLTSTDTDEAGPWRTDRTPYLREIMDALSVDDPTRMVVFMKGAQIGATQSANNFVGYAIHYAPGPILIVQPSIEMVKRNARQRIDPMIQACPALLDKIGPVSFGGRIRANNMMLSKTFPGGMLVMTGARSAAALRSMSARYLILDETDGYPLDVDNEGDPVLIAIARTRNFQRAKIYMISTPTVAGVSRIEAAFLQGDQRYFYVPCPHCGFFQVLRLGNRDTKFGLRWETTKTGKPKSSTYYQCADCAKFIEEHHKTVMLAKGEWRPTNAEPSEGVKSFHLSSLYSPYGWYSWREARDDFLSARRYPLKLKTFVNTVLGETWKDEVSKLDKGPLMERLENYPVDKNGERLVPQQVVILTGAIDVQVDRIEMTVYGWGAHPDFGAGAVEECWAIERHIIQGSPTAKETWDEAWRRMILPRAFEGGRTDYVRSWCVDAGYLTSKVYDFCRPRHRVTMPDNRKMWVFPTVGRAGPGNLWPRQGARQAKAKIMLWTLKVDAGKEALYTRLRMKSFGPGYIHFPKSPEYDDSFFAQLTAEQLTTTFDKKGFPVRVWSLNHPGARNEQLDLWVLSHAAFQALLAHGLDFAKEAKAVLKGLTRLPRAASKESAGQASSGDDRDRKPNRERNQQDTPLADLPVVAQPGSEDFEIAGESPFGVDSGLMEPGGGRPDSPLGPSTPRHLRRRRSSTAF